MATKLLIAALAVLMSGASAFAAGDVPVRNDKNRIVGYTDARPATGTTAAAKPWSFDLGAGLKSLFGTSQQSTAPASTKVVNDKNRIISNP